MEKEKLEKILADHKKWLNGQGGEKANLIRADLRDADLSYADLTYAGLAYADLRGANLSNVDLTYANLRGANLREAVLIDADLRYARLRGADLRGANLRGANFVETTGLTVLSVQVNTSDQNRRITYIPSLDIVTAGCFQGSFAKFRARVEETHRDNPFILARYRRVIAFFEGEAKADKEKDDRATDRQEVQD